MTVDFFFFKWKFFPDNSGTTFHYPVYKVSVMSFNHQVIILIKCLPALPQSAVLVGGRPRVNILYKYLTLALEVLPDEGETQSYTTLWSDKKRESTTCTKTHRDNIRDINSLIRQENRANDVYKDSQRQRHQGYQLLCTGATDRLH